MTGYFIGLAATRRHAWLVAWVGLAIAAVLHGLNDWGRVNGHSAWIVIVAASAVLFLGYARVGARSDQQFTEALPPVLRPHRTTPAGQAPSSVGGEPPRTPAELGVISPAQRGLEGKLPDQRAARPWWQP